jgi:hypothetical protein
LREPAVLMRNPMNGRSGIQMSITAILATA